jgi:hypothetical protein
MSSHSIQKKLFYTSAAKSGQVSITEEVISCSGHPCRRDLKTTYSRRMSSPKLSKAELQLVKTR